MTAATVNTPVLSRDPSSLPPELPRGSDIPEDLDPLAAGILMDHQKEWLEDKSDLKLCEKGRRTGITFAEALDDTLTAAASREAGGDNVFYIGDTKDKGREFIGYVAHFAKVVSGELADVEEFLFEDQKEDGSTRQISAFRIRFSSGFRVEALSSRPENIRGLQGVVVIDEAAFHKDVREVLDSVNALLIWGGKIRIISTHNGVLNPFNELIREAKAGKVPYSLHFIPFETAINNGLFKRVCMRNGEGYTKENEEAWVAKIRNAYGARKSKMRQELDAIPAEAEGSALTRVQIEACMKPGIPILRWDCDDDFKNAPEHIRKAEQLDWCREHIDPVVRKLDPTRPHCFGVDFARKGDLTFMLFFEIGRDLVRRTVFAIELRNVPFDQQRDVLFYAGDRLPRLAAGALDATGNGQYLAEKAAQKWGEIIQEVHMTASWYQANSPVYIEAFSDGTILLPLDEDVLKDHQALSYVNGIIRVPEDMRFKGADGFDRHGDSAPAGILAYFASRQAPVSYDYTPVTEAGARDHKGRHADDEPGYGGMDYQRKDGLY
jgi:phage FluMu gp28-like protein